MAAEYIKREDALNFEMEIEADPDEIQAITKGMSLYAEYIKSIPAADVVKRRKRKQHKTHRGCSTCAYYFLTAIEEPCNKCIYDPDKPSWKEDGGEDEN